MKNEEQNATYESISKKLTDAGLTVDFIINILDNPNEEISDALELHSKFELKSDVTTGGDAHA